MSRAPEQAHLVRGTADGFVGLARGVEFSLVFEQQPAQAPEQLFLVGIGRSLFNGLEDGAARFGVEQQDGLGGLFGGPMWNRRPFCAEPLQQTAARIWGGRIDCLGNDARRNPGGNENGECGGEKVGFHGERRLRKDWKEGGFFEE